MQNSDARVRIRRRALADAAFVVLVTFLVSIPVAQTHDSLLVGIATASIGLLFFMVRRSSDLARVADAVRADRLRLEGKGMSLADWRAGKPMPTWSERRAGPARRTPEAA